MSEILIVLALFLLVVGFLAAENGQRPLGLTLCSIGGFSAVVGAITMIGTA